MSKKNGKAAKKAVKKARPAKARMARAAASPSLARTRCATISVFNAGGAVKIRTSPHRLYANPEDSIEWTVVNMTGQADQPVTISWPGEGPWGKDPIHVNGWERKKVNNPTARRYKYTVTGFGAVEDPEIEIPEM